MGRVVEIMVRGDDQERKAATLLLIPTAEAPASTRPQRLFLHPHLTVPSLALRPKAEPQPLGLAFKVLMTRFQSVCQLDVLLLALLQPHQICRLSRPRLAMQVVSHTYVANLQQKPWMGQLTVKGRASVRRSSPR